MAQGRRLARGTGVRALVPPLARRAAAGLVLTRDASTQYVSPRALCTLYLLLVLYDARLRRRRSVPAAAAAARAARAGYRAAICRVPINTHFIDRATRVTHTTTSLLLILHTLIHTHNASQETPRYHRHKQVADCDARIQARSAALGQQEWTNRQTAGTGTRNRRLRAATLQYRALVTRATRVFFCEYCKAATVAVINRLHWPS